MYFLLSSEHEFNLFSCPDFLDHLIKAEGLKKANELKLVLPCLSNDIEFQQILYKEYLVYRLFNILSDYSFNVKLVNLRLTDKVNRKKYSWQTAFLIEDEEELAKRLKVNVLDTIGLGKTSYSSIDYTRFQIFQFMIGNTDWLPTTCHNIQLVEKLDGKILPIPFDFDFSGIVLAPYSSPNSWTDLKSVTDRCFMGNDKNEEEVNIILEEFRAKRTKFIKVIEEFPYLEKSRKKTMISFIDSFYRIINDEQQLKKHIIEKPRFLADRY